MSSAEKIPEKSLAACINSLQKEGYTENFMIKEHGLCDANASKIYSPEEVRIINFYRFEGESDPADSSILYAIETNDGRKGLISDAYGPYADGNITSFFAKVEDIMKKPNRE